MQFINIISDLPTPNTLRESTKILQTSAFNIMKDHNIILVWPNEPSPLGTVILRDQDITRKHFAQEIFTKMECSDSRIDASVDRQTR